MSKSSNETVKETSIDISLIEHNNRIEDNTVDIKELHDKTDKLLAWFELFKLEMSSLRDITNKVKGRLGI